MYLLLAGPNWPTELLRLYVGGSMLGIVGVFGLIVEGGYWNTFLPPYQVILPPTGS